MGRGTTWLVALTLALSGCHVLAGVEGLVFVDDAGDGAGATSATGGGAGGEPCEPGAIEPCYDGPDYDAGVGACQLGSRACLPDGSGFGACQGSVLAVHESCGATLDSNCDGDLACTGRPLAASALGGAETDAAVAVGVTAAGEIIVGGTFEGTITVGAAVHESRGQSDVFVARLDGRGAPIESRVFGSQGADQLQALAVASGGEVVIGGLYAPLDETDGLSLGSSVLHRSPYSSTTGEAFVAKLAPDLTSTWALGAGGYDRDVVHDLWVGGDGSVTAVARCWSDCRWSRTPETLDDFAVGEDWSVQSFDADGNLQFQDNFAYVLEGAAEPDFRVARTADGGVLVAGWIRGGLYPDPAQPPALDATDRETVFVARFDPAGVLIDLEPIAYALSGSGYGGIRLSDVAVGADGGIYVTGHFSGSTMVALPNTNRPGTGDADGFVLKLSDLGSSLIPSWLVVVGGAGTQVVTGVTVDVEGNVVVVGHADGATAVGAVDLPGADGHDVFVAKIEPDSSVLWARSLGAPLDQVAAAVDVLPTGHIAVVGSFYGSFTTPESSLVSSGKSDAFAAVLAP